MIKNEELRLGNYILADGKISYVSTIFPCFIQVNDNSRMEYSLSDDDEIVPIPLTEAVLMAVGCEKKTCGYGTPYLWNEYLFKNEGHMNFDKQGGGWLFKRSIYGNTIIIAEVEYLHQLQNLIFCLTNEELEINMEELKKAVG